MCAYKVVVVGDSAVGKTSIVDKYVESSFDSHSVPTVGVRTVAVDLNDGSAEKTKLCVYDTAGQEAYQSLIPSYSRDSDICVVVGDIASELSIEHMEHWIRCVLDVSPDAIVIPVINKIDSVKFTPSQASAIQSRLGTYQNLMFTSALTGQGIQELFVCIASELQQKTKKHETPVIIEEVKHKSCCAS